MPQLIIIRNWWRRQRPTLKLDIIASALTATLLTTIMILLHA
jgi:hypothetical protein